MKLLYLLILLPCCSFAGSYIANHERGWFWYEKELIQSKQKEENKKETQPAPYPATQQMTVVQQEIAESLNRAILNPSEENLLHYANTYYRTINQGQDFTTGYRMLLLKYPEYNYYLQFPINHNARLVHERQQSQQSEEAVRALAKTHGFLYFFASNCPYCEIFSPTVKRFANRFGIHVMAVSLDGGFCKEFPQAVPNNGIAQKLGVKSWPALFAVNPKTGKVIPLSYGVVSVSELEETVLEYAKFAEGKAIDHAFK